jgi:hypothetical protein
MERNRKKFEYLKATDRKRFTKINRRNARKKYSNVHISETTRIQGCHCLCIHALEKKLGWSKTNIVENLKQKEAPKTPAFDCRLAEPRILTRNNFKQRENIPIHENTASACTMQKWLQLVALLAGCITLQATSKNPC